MFGDDFFASLQPKDTKKEEKKEKQRVANIPKPPNTRFEWMRENRLSIWPLAPAEDELISNSDSNSSGASSNGEELPRELEGIKRLLMEKTKWDDMILEDIGERLSRMEDRLSQLMERILYERDKVKETESTAEDGGLKMIDETSNLQVYCSEELMNAMEHQTGHSRHTQPLDQHDEYNQSTDINVIAGEPAVKKESFGSYLSGFPPPLPNKLEPLPILDLVTKVQKFKPNFYRSWRKFFFTESSCIILQCAFWWLWLETVQPNNESQDQLFTLMADRFTSLFMNTNNDDKDEIFQQYPRCLSQCVFAVFCRGYPDNINIFTKDVFLQRLTNNIHEWISGIPSTIRNWTSWPMEVLNPQHNDMTMDMPSSSTQSTDNRQPNQTHHHGNEMRSIERSHDIPHGSTTAYNEGEFTSERGTYSTGDHPAGTGVITGVKEAPYSGPIAGNRGRLMPSGNTKGSAFECVRFATSSKSPLLQHHLLKHGLTDLHQSVVANNKTIISRTQVKKLESSGTTLDDIIKTSKELSDKRQKDYEQQIESYQRQVNEVISDNKQNQRYMRKETKRLLEEKHHVAIQAEKIVNRYSTQSPNITTTGDGKK